MGFGKSSNSATLDDILRVVSEFEILAHYLGISQIPCVINSPFRKDERPSFGIYSKDGIRVSYYDYGTRESGGIIDLLSNLWKLNFKDTVTRIAEDLPQFAQNNDSVIVKTGARNSGRHIYSSNVDLKVKTREFMQHDILYWGRYGISLPWLKFGNVFPISHILVYKRDNNFVIPADKHAYVYVEFKDDTPSYKIYQPFSKTHKWASKHDSSVWDLWEQLPASGENLIITSSRKDALCVWENTGIPSCSLQAESYFPKDHVMQQLKDRFNNIFVLYDNDSDKEANYGRMYGNTLAGYFNIHQIEIPDVYNSKDPSDLCFNFNREKVKEVIPYLIREKLNNSFQ